MTIQNNTLYHVHTETFEGPIELLLRLIEQRKLPIAEVSLAEVTNDYLSRIQNLDQMPYGHVTQFILVASTLVLIKSKSLLPLLQLTDEEEQDIHTLEQRLRMYKIFQDLTLNIESRYATQPSFARTYRHRDPVFSPDKKMTGEIFASLLGEVLHAVPQPQTLEETSVATVMRIDDMMEHLERRMQLGVQKSFNDLMQKGRVGKTAQEQKEIKVEVVVGFLAMLEMVRNGILDVMQSELFQDILMEKR